MPTVKAKVSKTTYSSGTYHVLKVEAIESSEPCSKTVTAAGHLFGLPDHIFVGTTFELVGDWSFHKKYGKQFKITSWRPWAPDVWGVGFFLDNVLGLVRDRDLLRKITKAFGSNTFQILGEADPSVWVTAGDTNSDHGELLSIWESWKTLLAMASLAEYFAEFELGGHLLSLIYAKFGDSAKEIVDQNPYRLVEIEGISFKRADQIAITRGIGPGDMRRVEAAVLWSINQTIRQNGHLFARRGDLPSMVRELGQKEATAPFPSEGLEKMVSQAIHNLETHKAVVVEPDIGVYPSQYHKYERESALILQELMEPSPLTVDFNAFLADYEATNGLKLSEQQQLALNTLLTNKVLVITGAPGTGKTTVLRAFVALFNTLNLSYSLVAPTGIAAKRLGYVTGTPATTVHRALGYDGFRWPERELESDAVILDEMSMVDQELLYRLLSSLKLGSYLVVVGDDDQLPSVGPGNVLRELIASKVPTVRLEHVFRQAETSDIILAAHKIRKGESPLTLPKKENTEFSFMPISDERVIATLIVKMARKLKDRKDPFQVISPKYDGVVGVNNLNLLLRDELNPDVGQPSCEILGFHTRVGDRLMVVKNDYKLGIYNGDMGKLEYIDHDNLAIKIYGVGNTEDLVVKIPKDDAPHMLKLAYAVTVHKFQGEEIGTVILPIVRSQGRMLQRNLLYTAITRSRSKVWLLGDAEAVSKAVENNIVVKRNTVLRDLV